LLWCDASDVYDSLDTGKEVPSKVAVFVSVSALCLHAYIPDGSPRPASSSGFSVFLKASCQDGFFLHAYSHLECHDRIFFNLLSHADCNDSKT
jgi:hypothetical protein